MTDTDIATRLNRIEELLLGLTPKTEPIRIPINPEKGIIIKYDMLATLIKKKLSQLLQQHQPTIDLKVLDLIDFETIILDSSFHSREIKNGFAEVHLDDDSDLPDEDTHHEFTEEHPLPHRQDMPKKEKVVTQKKSSNTDADQAKAEKDAQKKYDAQKKADDAQKKAEKDFQKKADDAQKKAEKQENAMMKKEDVASRKLETAKPKKKLNAEADQKKAEKEEKDAQKKLAKEEKDAQKKLEKEEKDAQKKLEKDAQKKAPAEKKASTRKSKAPQNTTIILPNSNKNTPVSKPTLSLMIPSSPPPPQMNEEFQEEEHNDDEDGSPGHSSSTPQDSEDEVDVVVDKNKMQILTRYSIPSIPNVKYFAQQGQYVYECIVSDEHPDGKIDFTNSVGVMTNNSRIIYSLGYKHYAEKMVLSN